MLRTVRISLLALCLIAGFYGCAPKPEPKIPMTEAQKKFEAKCREYDIHVTTHLVGKTLWIYLPTKEPLFDYEAQKESSAEATKKPNKYAVQYADGNYKDKRFSFEYDIIDKKKTKAEDYGYTSSYTDSYIKAQNSLFTALSEVFFNTEDANGILNPNFVVMVITDIKKGIETRATLYLEDFKRYMTQDLPYDEYMKRFLADTKGGQSLIGDEIGSHIQYKDIEMPDFLTKQIVNRINFKFQRSDNPPADDFDTAIVGIIADTLRYYHFSDFTSVELTNLRVPENQDKRKKMIFERNQLSSFGDDPEEKKGSNGGKLIHIRFENGEAKITE